jgi:D-sedoheptulose 7-phosphate isomerase
VKNRAREIAGESIAVQERFTESCLEEVVRIAELVIGAIRGGRRVYVFGCGGSAADGQHLAGELVGRFRRERPGWPCVALSTDTSVLTAWANDYGWDTVYARQIQALAGEGDVAIGISTSGNSPVVVKAVEEADRLGARTVGLTGAGGGRLKDLCDICLRAPSDETPRIQECHGLAIHILCELVEAALTG